MFQLVTIIVPFITAPYLARILGVSGVGIASYTLSLVSYFIIFSNLGISSFGQREIAMYQDDKKKYSEVFWNLIIYQFIIGLVSLLSYFIFIMIMNKDNLIMSILTINLIANIFDITWLYRGIEEYKYISFRNILIKILFVIAIFIFVKSSDDLYLYIFLNSLSLIISSLALWIGLIKRVEKINIKKIKAFYYWKETLVYFLPQIALQIYTVLDKTMLGIITGDNLENGYYEQAHKIVGIITTIITSLNTVMLPRMSFLYKKNENEKIKQMLKKTMQFTCAISIPLCLGIAAISSSFVTWFFGEEYAKVKILLPLFSPLIMIVSISGCVEGQCLVPCGMREKSSFALWGGAIANFVLNLIMIPYLKSIGSVIASVMAELVVCILFLHYAKEYIKTKDIIYNARNYIFSGIIMFIIVYTLNTILSISIINTIITIVVGGCIYLLVLFLLKDELLNIILNTLKFNNKKS